MLKAPRPRNQRTNPTVNIFVIEGLGAVRQHENDAANMTQSCIVHLGALEAQITFPPVFLRPHFPCAFTIANRNRNRAKTQARGRVSANIANIKPYADVGPRCCTDTDTDRASRTGNSSRKKQRVENENRAHAGAGFFLPSWALKPSEMPAHQRGHGRIRDEKNKIYDQTEFSRYIRCAGCERANRPEPWIFLLPGFAGAFFLFLLHHSTPAPAPPAQRVFAYLFIRAKPTFTTNLQTHLPDGRKKSYPASACLLACLGGVCGGARICPRRLRWARRGCTDGWDGGNDNNKFVIF